MPQTLKGRRSPLADPALQREILSNHLPEIRALPRFHERLGRRGPLATNGIRVLQLNLGKRCNQACRHCHVDAGPDRKEVMSRATMERCVELVRAYEPAVVDLTGGAPELNPGFRWLIEELTSCPISVPGGLEIIDRCNLTVLVANESFADLPAFFAAHRVHVISSLPYYAPGFVERQRGQGVFDASIAALRLLNQVGYGRPGSGLTLDLVYNPCGAFLPADQATLEAQYKTALREQFAIVFNGLLTITNMPIARFLEYLVDSGNLVGYMETLVAAFNPAAVDGLMCREMISIGWDGTIYDCDFNQMLDLPAAGSPHVSTADWPALSQRLIRTGQHCYGCTAGAGSSCRGALTVERPR